MATSKAVVEREHLGFGHKLRHIFPDLGIIEPLNMLGSGFRSTVVETADGVIFRIGRNAEATAGYLREIRLLPALPRHLPIAIPQPGWSSGPSPQFPFGIMGYPKVPGSSLRPGLLSDAGESSLAAQVGRFLQALHRFPVDRAIALGVPRSEPRGGEIESWRDTVLPALRASLNHAEHQRVVRWWDAFQLDRSLDRYTPALIHGDLWYEHVLMDEAQQNITGVVDFESAAIGDIAQDFATQRHVGKQFAALVMVAYQAAGGRLDEDIERRVQTLWELREFEGLAFAVRTGDTTEMNDAIRKIRAGPLLSRDGSG